MTNTTIKTVRVGQMPGKINEFAVEVGTSIGALLDLAELNAEGFEIKVDGQVATTDSVVSNSTNLVLLAKQVKGNSGTVRIGQMPGRIEEYALDAGSTFADALSVAGLSSEGFEVKADGAKVNDLNSEVGSTSLILLAKQVKGNSGTVRVGQMPGKIEEYAVDPSSSVADVLSLAGLSADGFEVKADGTKVTDLNAPIGTTSLLLLAKQVKGNK